MSISNIHPDTVQSHSTPIEMSAMRLVTDSVAAIIDERKAQGETTISLDDLTERLVTQFNNLPGFNADDFRTRASASAKIAELQHPGDRGTAKLDALARRAEEKHRKAG